MEKMYPPTPTPPSIPPNPFLNALRALWRFFLLLLTGILVGAVIYFGFVQFYMNAVQVSQDSTGRLSASETLSVQEQQQVSSRMNTFSQRLAGVENQQGKQNEAVSELKGRTTSLEQTMSEHTTLLAKVAQLEGRVETLTADLKSNTSQDQALQESLTALDSPTAAMARDLQVLKAMELVSRARLNLIQNNAGLARTDVESAYGILAAMKENTPDAQKPLVDVWLQRLSLVLGNLPASPVMAADDLEIAWRLLANGWDNSGGNLLLSPTAPAVTPTLPAQTPLPTSTPAA